MSRSRHMICIDWMIRVSLLQFQISSTDKNIQQKKFYGFMFVYFFIDKHETDAIIFINKTFERFRFCDRETERE